MVEYKQNITQIIIPKKAKMVDFVTCYTAPQGLEYFLKIGSFILYSLCCDLYSKIATADCAILLIV